MHLVAELFDNATAFSPPDSNVMVEARRVGDRAALYVEDRGIGISGDQLRDLNERLEAMTGTEIINLATVGGGVTINRFLLDYFLDDQSPPFRPNPHFAQWFPDRDCAHALLLVGGAVTTR